jgi:hypothetical protein
MPRTERSSAQKDEQDLSKAVAYCARWGVELRESGSCSSGCEAPYGGGGIDWKARAIIFKLRFYEDSGIAACALVHELSHILCGVHPDEVDEVDSEMLALDFYGNRYLKLSKWGTWMSSYWIESSPLSKLCSHAPEFCECFHGEWPTLTTRARGKLIDHSRALAVEAGLLTRSGRPTFLQHRSA